MQAGSVVPGSTLALTASLSGRPAYPTGSSTFLPGGLKGITDTSETQSLIPSPPHKAVLSLLCITKGHHHPLAAQAKTLDSSFFFTPPPPHLSHQPVLSALPQTHPLPCFPKPKSRITASPDPVVLEEPESKPEINKFLKKDATKVTKGDKLPEPTATRMEHVRPLSQ